MAVMNSSLHPVLPNRRRRVRHKIQTPAYATFTEQSQGSTLDLHEIVDISEDGIALQCHAPLEVKTQVNLCLDLADCPEQIYTTGKVIWSNSSGRAGLRFSELPPESLSRLRQWLFVNVMSGVAHGETQLGVFVADAPPRPNYSDSLAAITAVQRQVEALGSNLAAAMQLIAERAQTLVHASGAAIALAEDDPGVLVCSATSGPDAPPVGARLQIGSGFSGECVKTGTSLRCDDTEIDSRVDRESCRALGIRCMLAVPLRAGENSIGILEVFSGQPNRFSDADERVLQRLAQVVLAIVPRTVRVDDPPPLRPASVEPCFPPTPGSLLFASVPDPEEKVEFIEEKVSSGISLPRSHLILLICAAAAIAMVLGYNLAPLIQKNMNQRARTPMQTVLASSQPPKYDSPQPATPAMEATSFELMRQLAQDGDPVAEYALALRYFEGDEKNRLVRDEKQAFRWFSRAAEHGSLAAQAKLGFLYWGGRGIPKDLNQAYFWTVLARARGDQENKDLAAILASGMTRSQAAAIEQQADLWLQQHLRKKPAAGRLSTQLRTSVVPPAIK
ncbi:MAG TPA: GAF domain-containing protein [Candidatus Sulfotelmatobacter sp.]|nr:GAF domain-containing protein [Candidatus Sulfotelmatobacter sp.]